MDEEHICELCDKKIEGEKPWWYMEDLPVHKNCVLPDMDKYCSACDSYWADADNQLCSCPDCSVTGLEPYSYTPEVDK